MSDIFKPIPDSVAKAARFAVNHPKITRVGALTLSASLALATVTPEGSPRFNRVMVGSTDPNTRAELIEHGATLWYAPSTETAPLGTAQIGAKLNVDYTVQGDLTDGEWIRVSLPDEPGKRILLNHGIQGNEIFPDHAYISEDQVVGVFENPKK